MSKRGFSAVCLVAVIALSAGSSMAQDDDEFGLRGWGPRVGLAADPDQIVAGVHFDLGERADARRLLARALELDPKMHGADTARATLAILGEAEPPKP